MIVKSAVSTRVKKDALFKGTLLAGIGMMILIGGSVFLTREHLSVYGFLIFGLGIGLVTWGMIPYRRLVRLENSPDEIHVNEDHTWIYYIKGKKTLEIPEETIESVNYLSKNSEYGLCLKLRKEPTKKVKVHSPLWQSSHSGKFGCDIFLPYFTERSCTMLKTDSK